MYWMMSAVAGISLGIGTTVGVGILLLVQVRYTTAPHTHTHTQHKSNFGLDNELNMPSTVYNVLAVVHVQGVY